MSEKEPFVWRKVIEFAPKLDNTIKGMQVEFE